MTESSSFANSRLLRALRRQRTDCAPVWLMRQAGRYLPEYRRTREHAGDFLTLCKTPELACEVTLQPLRRFALDAAIVFSDILTVGDAFGLGLSVNEGEGPRFARPLCDARAIAQLPAMDVHIELRYALDAIALIRRELNPLTPLIGFVGSPWTLAAYMVDGRGGDFNRAKRLLYDDPHSAHQLLGKLSDALADYLCAQARAGAQALMVFDTWGGLLSTAAYAEFSLRYLGEMVARVKSDSHGVDAPIILFTKGGGAWLEAIADTGCDAVSLDWTVAPADARKRIGHRVALQGNLDPAVLRASPAVIEREVGAVLTQFGDAPGHVFNLGHGITPDIDPAHVAQLVDAVHRLSRVD